MRISKSGRVITLAGDFMDALVDNLPETIDNVESYLNSKDADQLVNELLKVVDEHITEAMNRLQDITK